MNAPHQRLRDEPPTMETSPRGITAPSAVYEIAGRRIEVGARGFAEAVADAHTAHQRLRCMCMAEGVDMYVARLAGTHGGYIVKRMPHTGSHHAPDCPSYEPPAEFSGLGQVLGSAITENPATGETTLKLDFPLTKMPCRSQVPPAGGDSDSDSVTSNGTSLSLRGLLHYLWDQAELTRWHPGFAGKRNWATVRRLLLQAAEHKMARGNALRSRLYVPEPFSVDERDAINARRLAQWQHAAAVPGRPQRLMLLIGVVKEIKPARYGYTAVVKHMPDQAFAIDEEVYRRLGRHFERELALWGSSEDIRMVAIASFGVSGVGVPWFQELCLMPVTHEWLPVEDGYEKLLLDRLVREARSFIKGLRYNVSRHCSMPSAVLIDCGAALPMLSVSTYQDGSPESDRMPPEGPEFAWNWRPKVGPMPPLPPAVRR